MATDWIRRNPGWAVVVSVISGVIGWLCVQVISLLIWQAATESNRFTMADWVQQRDKLLNDVSNQVKAGDSDILRRLDGLERKVDKIAEIERHLEGISKYLEQERRDQ